MAQAKTPSNPSIIETIDKMVRDGESEETILNTLKDIGVSPDNAKRLLILGQADVFSLLKGEIKRTIRAQVETEGVSPRTQSIAEGTDTVKSLGELKEYEKSLVKQQESFKQEIDEKIRRINEMEEKTKNNFSTQSRASQEQILSSLKEYEKGLSAQNKAFQEQVLSKVSKGATLSDKAKLEFTSLGAKDQSSDSFRNYQKTLMAQNKEFEQSISQKILQMNELEEKTQKRLSQITDEVKKVESDIGDAGMSGVGTRNKIVSYAVIGLGVVFGLGTLFTFFTSMNAPFTTQSIITMTVMAIITVTLLVVGTLI